MAGLIIDRHNLLIDDDGNPLRDEEGNFHVLDTTTNNVYIVNDCEEVRQFFNRSDDTVPNSIPASVEASTNSQYEQKNGMTALKTQQVCVKWTDENAVRALIKLWQDHEPLFKSAAIKNSEVWRMIAEGLKKINNLWTFNNIQCENKFKDLRRNYTSTKDHNAQTGVQPKTCKFYEEMEEVLCTKPNIRPVAIASNLKARSAVLRSQNPSAQSEKNLIGACVNSECEDGEGNINSKVEPMRKKTRWSREIEALELANQAEAQKREEARERRHRENMEKKEKAIKIYETFMTKLLEKL